MFEYVVGRSLRFRLLLTDAVRLLRRRRLVAGRRLGQRRARRLPGEFGDLVILAAEHAAPDTGLLVHLFRGKPVARRRGVRIALAAARRRARIAAGRQLIRPQRILLAFALLADVAIALLLRLQLAAADVRILRPRRVICKRGVGFFRRLESMGRREHQWRALPVADRFAAVASQADALENAANDFG